MSKDGRRKAVLWISGAAIVCLGLYLGVGWGREEIDQEIRQAQGGSYLALDQGSVHYQWIGPEHGDLVVLIHGFSVPSYVWDPTVEALTSAGFQVLRYDLYGRGYSDRPQAEYDLQFFTLQLEELLSGLQVDRPVHVVGLSLGGPIAARFSVRNPEKVHSVTLIAPDAVQLSPGDIFPLQVPGLGEFITRVYLVPVMLPGAQSDDFYRPERFPGWEERYRDQIQYRGFGRAVLSTIRNLPGVDPLEEYSRLAELDPPVLLIWGREDGTFSRQDMKEVQHRLPNLTFVPVPQAGHLPHLEGPELVHDALISFLRVQR